MIFGEIKRQFIARPDEAKDQILYKWPDKNIRMFTQLTVQQDEVAVFFKDGQVVGTLGAGRHNLDGKDIPFLGLIIDALTGGNILLSELYFVSSREFTNLPFGGQLDAVNDKSTDLVLDLRLFGEYSLKVSNPEKLITTLVGTQNMESNEELTEWIKTQILKRARETVVQKIAAGEWSVVGIAQYHSALEEILLQTSVANLQTYGVELVKFGNIAISMSPEDADMLKKLKRDIAYAKAGAADAAMKVGIGRGMENGSDSGSAAGTGSGIGLGVGIAIGADLVKGKSESK